MYFQALTTTKQPRMLLSLSGCTTMSILVHGNVQDYVGGLVGHTLKNYLISSFSERDLVVCGDRASGFTLPSAKMRQTFVEFAGIPIPSSTPEGSTLAPGQSGLSGGLNQVAAPSAAGDLAAILEVLTSAAFQSVASKNVPTREEYAVLAKVMKGVYRRRD